MAFIKTKLGTHLYKILLNHFHNGIWIFRTFDEIFQWKKLTCVVERPKVVNRVVKF